MDDAIAGSGHGERTDKELLAYQVFDKMPLKGVTIPTERHND